MNKHSQNGSSVEYSQLKNYGKITQLEQDLAQAQTLSFTQSLDIVIKKLRLMSAETRAIGDMVRDYEDNTPYYRHAHKYQHIAEELQHLLDGLTGDDC